LQHEQQQAAARNFWDYEAIADTTKFARFCSDLQTWRDKPETQLAIDQSIAAGTSDSTWDLVNGNILAVAKQHFSAKPTAPNTGFFTEATRELHRVAQQAFDGLRQTNLFQLYRQELGNARPSGSFLTHGSVPFILKGLIGILRTR